MAASDQNALAAEFLSMHRGGDILVLLNAWDVASARVFERLGARAIATTSMGIAASAGYGEGEFTPWSLMLDAIGAIASAVRVPVTADLERGYGKTPEEVARSVARAIERGVVGVNLEDSLGGPGFELAETEVLAERLGVIRRSSGPIRPVLNARTDAFLDRRRSSAAALRETIARGNAYRAAGADCVFVPGGLDRATIRTLVHEIDAPLNVVANPAVGSNVPTIPELRDLGVARVSVGSGLMRAALSFARRAAEEVLTSGTYALFGDELRRPGAQESYEMAIAEPAPL